MTIRELIDALVANPNQRVTVKGVSKNIVGFAEFKTVNLADNGYFKVIFDDHSFLFIVPNDNLILYTDETPAAFSEIRDEEIGNKQELSFRGKEYTLDNINDYQYVIRLIKGEYSSIEGEVKFSDYVPKDGSNELLSLGWIVRTGERADINPKGIDLSEIKLLD
jgi:hypothetical protein